MKKNYLILLSFFFSLYSLHSQDIDCEYNINKAKELLKENSPFNDEDIIFKLVAPCAEKGIPDAENLLGVLYLKGIGTEVDNSKALSFITSSAEKGHSNAQYNLGSIYKTGAGCEINFTTAIDWFEKSSANGNQKAIYSLGYMYYKGLGVEQDYEAAINWFKISDDPMAKHFLGLCYYQGYGIEANEDKALELLLTNDIVNSSTLITYIQNNQKENSEIAVEKVLETNSSTPNTNINLKASLSTSINNSQNKETPTIEDLSGDWIGKLIQYDWSGTKIERILPIELSFDSKGNSLSLDYSFLEQKSKINALLQDDYISFKKPFNFTLDKLYSSNPKELTLDYRVFSIKLKKQIISNRNYLIGSVDTYIENWKEYGQPTRIVLKQKNNQTEEEDTEDEILLALAEQENQFIKLYPVPFVNQLTVQYQLETSANIYIELVSINGGKSIVVTPSTFQEAGDYTYTVPVNNSLPNGLYAVRLVAGDQLYTRLIIKEN